MVRKLRNKFVIVTTTLMLVVFGIFGIINTIYNNYWNEMEMAEMLDWIAYSGIFSSNEGRMLNEELVLDMMSDEKPIVGIVLDSEGNIIHRSVIGNEKEMNSISGKALEKMCRYGNSRNKIGRYFYSYTQTSDDEYLLVILDSLSNEHIVLKLIGRCALIGVGIIVLVVVTFFLSRFVTEPAEKTLLREKRFISDASHELKTPLGAICVNAQALEIEEKDNLYIKNIISESNRMSRLIERLLTLSRLDEIETDERYKMSLSEICEEMTLTYEGIAFEKNIKYEYDITPEVWIKGNEDEIRQLLAILIDNALKNTNEGGAIHIICKKIRSHAQLSVTNTGRGIEPNDIPHVFERFYTSDSTRERSSFGLGLAIAKSIVERHSGDISVESVPDDKTTFKVNL